MLSSDPPGARLSETIDVAGPAANEIEQRIRAVFEAHGCTAARVGPSTLRFARTIRPGAMSISNGAAAIVTAGLLLPLVFLRRTEECTLTLVEHPTGAKVTIVGRVPRAAVDTLRNRLGAPRDAEARLDVGTFVPGPSSPSPEFETKPRAEPATSELAPDATRPREQRAAQPPKLPPMGWLLFDTGERIALEGKILVGRAPDTSDPEVRLVAIADPARTVSKIHFRLMARDGVAWIEDLESTNGTAVAMPDQPTRRLLLGERSPLAVGARIEFGDRVVKVVPA